MDRFTLYELACFDAVATEGGFQAAAAKLHRSHPTVFAAVAKLERQLGVVLLDRSGYRVALTKDGRAFHQRARSLLRESETLSAHAAQLARGEESDLRVVLGDVCPVAQTLSLLSRFFKTCPATRLHLHFEAIAGPWERLFDGDADLILHHIDKTDSRLEFINLYKSRIVPVVAPGFLPFPVTRSITPTMMSGLVQCVIRDTARHSAARNYFLIEGTPQWTVADQLMKKEIIVQGMGWGHMPSFLVEDELRDGRLLSIAGRHLPGLHGDLVAARRRDTPHGPVAERLWHYIETQGPRHLRQRPETGKGSGHAVF